jgi:hypothetical protein
MANLQVRQKIRTGRTFITVSATPKSPKTRRLLRRFRREVQTFEKRWKAVVRAAQKASRSRR